MRCARSRGWQGLLRRWAVVVGLVLAGVLGAPPGAAAGGTTERGWPLQGPREVSRPFAPPEVRYAAGHRGVDLPSTPGAPVLAAAAGRVTYAGLLAGRGVVVVSHGELRTTYEPVSAAVQVGELVEVGSLLGRLEAGHLGCAVQACLHWGLKRGEDYLDPVRWVAGGPVRLLPVDDAVSGAGGGAASWAGAGGPVGPRQGVEGGAAAAQQAVPGGAAASVARPASPGVAGGGQGVGAAAGVPPASRGSVPAPAPASSGLALAPAPEPEPRWSLRSAEAPLGAAAVAALVAGIGLLARPRPPAPEPGTGGAAVPVPEPVEDDEAGPPGELVDLEAARLRRRSG